MLTLQSLHHVAIICRDIARSRQFYTDVLGFEVIREVYRADRDSHKLDLSLNGAYLIELFSFPDPPPRPTRPEARGLRHLAFAVADVDAAVVALRARKVPVEEVRTDEWTDRRFTFLRDPDDLPIELYQVG